MDGTWTYWSGSSIPLQDYHASNTASGGWNVSCGSESDSDNDGVFDIEDNCPDVANPSQGDTDNDGIGNTCDNCPDTSNHNQIDIDSDGIGDLCDTDTIYGTISGDAQEGITVNMFIVSCGEPQPHITVITDANGYYAIGDLDNGRRYLVGLDDAGYSFSSSYWVDIPQTEIQSYDFTATNLTCDTVDRFLDNGDGTVTDCRTDLIWLKDADCFDGLNGLSNAPYASTLVSNINSGECGLTDGSVEGDWHLPTKEEMQGIGTDPPTTWDEGSPTVTWTKPDEFFVNLHSEWYWSSSPVDNTTRYWIVDMRSGSLIDYNSFMIWILAWAVRGPN